MLVTGGIRLTFFPPFFGGEQFQPEDLGMNQLIPDRPVNPQAVTKKPGPGIMVLVGGLDHFLFSISYMGMSSSQLLLTPSFFRGVGLNHQPVVIGPRGHLWEIWDIFRRKIPRYIPSIFS